jgi:hypothetical protein
MFEYSWNQGQGFQYSAISAKSSQTALKIGHDRGMHPAMARLHEYQGKAILAVNGFKIPSGRAAT